MKRLFACASLAVALAGCSKPQTQTAAAPQPTAPQVTATPAQPPVAPPPQPIATPAAPVATTTPAPSLSPATANEPSTQAPQRNTSTQNLRPKQIVAIAAGQIRAAQTDEELLSLQGSFLSDKFGFLDARDHINPRTPNGREEYMLANQMASLMSNLADACRNKRESKGYSVPSYVWEKDIRQAEFMANLIENPIRETPGGWQKRFDEERAKDARLRDQR